METFDLGDCLVVWEYDGHVVIGDNDGWPEAQTFMFTREQAFKLHEWLTAYLDLDDNGQEVRED